MFIARGRGKFFLKFVFLLYKGILENKKFRRIFRTEKYDDLVSFIFLKKSPVYNAKNFMKNRLNFL